MLKKQQDVPGARERFSTMSVWFHQAKASIGNVQHVLPVRKVLDPRISAMEEMGKSTASFVMEENLLLWVTVVHPVQIGWIQSQTMS